MCNRRLYSPETAVMAGKATALVLKPHVLKLPATQRISCERTVRDWAEHIGSAKREAGNF